MWEGWTEWATTDPDTIKSWWVDPISGQEQDYNIGELTTGIVVLDLDEKKGKHGVEYYQLLGGDMDTLTVETPSGGRHLHFFDRDVSIASPWAEGGIDIRSHNGYVVAPGSRTDEGSYRVLADRPMRQLQPYFSAQLREVGVRKSRASDAFVELDTPGAVQNATSFMLAAPPSIEGQNGHDNAYRCASRIVRDYGLSEVTALNVMLEHWNERCQPPWQPEELYAVIQHANEYGQNELGAQRTEVNFDAVTVLPQIAERPVRSFGVYMGNVPDICELKPMPWMVEHLAMRGETSLLSALGSGGKSTLSIICAAHFAVGRDFGKLKISEGKPLRVLLYNMEDTTNTMAIRLAAICASYRINYTEARANIAMIGKGDIPPIRVAYMDRSEPRMDLEGRARLAKIIAECEVDLAFLDPLITMHGMNESDNVPMRYVVSVLDGVSVECKAGLVVVAHNSKASSSSERPQSSDIRGASAIVDGVRVVVTMSPPTPADAEAMGVQVNDVKRYIRLDNVKANYLPPAFAALDWLKWETVIAPGVNTPIGVPVPMSAKAQTKLTNGSLVTIIREYLITEGMGAQFEKNVVEHIRTMDKVYNLAKPEAVVKRVMQALADQPEGTPDRIKAFFDGKAGKRMIGFE